MGLGHVVAGVGAVALLARRVSSAAGSGWWDRSRAGPSLARPPRLQPRPRRRRAGGRARRASRESLRLRSTEGRLAEPAGDNALDRLSRRFSRGRRRDQAAREALSSVVDDLFKRAEEALLADALGGRGYGARSRPARRSREQSSRVSRCAARARGLAVLAAAPPQPAVSPPPVAASPTELDSVLNLATARLRRGQILSS